MARIAVNIDHVLINPRTGEAMQGAHLAMRHLAGMGHHITAFSVHAPGLAVRTDLPEQLRKLGIHFDDFHHKQPPADVVIGNRVVPFRGNWGQTLAQTLMLVDTPHGHEKSVEDEVVDDVDLPQAVGDAGSAED